MPVALRILLALVATVVWGVFSAIIKLGGRKQ